MTLIERTKILSDKLSALMANPEPGLVTWCVEVGEVCKEIGKLAK